MYMYAQALCSVFPCLTNYSPALPQPLENLPQPSAGELLLST